MVGDAKRAPLVTEDEFRIPVPVATEVVNAEVVAEGAGLEAELEEAEGAVEAEEMESVMPTELQNFCAMVVVSARFSDDEWKELRKFQSDLPFTVAQLEDGFSLLDGATTPNGNLEPITTVVSGLPVGIVETGSTVTGEASIPFPLYPDDQSREPPIKGAEMRFGDRGQGMRRMGLKNGKEWMGRGRGEWEEGKGRSFLPNFAALSRTSSIVLSWQQISGKSRSGCLVGSTRNVRWYGGSGKKA